jgi:2,4-dienoyl-CoA reductase-like NADH-dependent reductase (Old Yellow Enzyme family)
MDPFTPLPINTGTLPNRLIMAPIKTGYATRHGLVTDRQVAYYRRRAQGGVGTIIVEPLFVDSVGKEHPRQLGLETFDQMKGLKNLVNALHQQGVWAVAHLNHAGRGANPTASGESPEAPPIGSALFHLRGNGAGHVG